MRRAGRGGSPEIVVEPCDYSSPCSAAESNFRELDDVFLQTQTRIWLGEVLHVRFDEETSIADLLADGELLEHSLHMQNFYFDVTMFQLSKVVWRVLLKRDAELKHSKVYIHERASFCKSRGRYMAYPKVDSFLRICQILGMTGIDLFSSSDVVEKRDTRKVCMCIRSLSKKARAKDLHVPDFDIVTYTIAMPKYMVGSIRRRLEQYCWSPTNSSVCSPCIDLKEIDRQGSLDSDSMWHHSPWSESDDAEEPYREYELQSPASIASYDEAEMSSFCAEKFPGSYSAAEENICPPSQNIYMTWEPDEVIDSIQSAKSYLKTSVQLSHLSSRSNSCLQDTTVCCCKSPIACVCDAQLNMKTTKSIEDKSWLQTKTRSVSEFKLDIDYSIAETLPFKDLTRKSDLCLTKNTKEEKHVVGISSPVVNTAKYEVAKGSQHVLEYENGPSECTPLYLSCGDQQHELKLMNMDRNMSWGDNNIPILSTDSHVNHSLVQGFLGLLPDDSNSTSQEISNPSVSVQMMPENQSKSDVVAFTLHLGDSGNNTTCEHSKGEIVVTANQYSENTIPAIYENLLDARERFHLRDSQSSQNNSKTDLVDEIVLKELPHSISHKESSTATLNDASLDGNESERASNMLYNQNVGIVVSDSTADHELQASVSDSGTYTSHLLSACQMPFGCCVSNKNFLPRKAGSTQLDVTHTGSDSRTDSLKQKRGSSNGDSLFSTNEQSSCFSAQLPDQPLSLDFFRRTNHSSTEEKLIFEKLVDENAKTFCNTYADMKQIPTKNIYANVPERRSSEILFCAPDISNDGTADYHHETVDETSLSHSVQKAAVNNVWLEDSTNLTVYNQQVITESDGISCTSETNETCRCCETGQLVGISQDSLVEPWPGNSADNCVNDKEEQHIDCIEIPEASVQKCLANDETFPGSLYKEESLASNLHDSETCCLEELHKGTIQRKNMDVSLNPGSPIGDFSERQVFTVSQQCHSDWPQACASCNEGVKMSLAANMVTLRYIGNVNLENSSSYPHDDYHTACLEFNRPYALKEEGSYTTICPLDLKNIVDQSSKISNGQQPLGGDSASIMHLNDFACTETQNKEMEDHIWTVAAWSDEINTEEAARPEPNTARKMLLKSLAGGVTAIGAFLLLLHFRKRRDREHAATNAVKFQTESTRHGRRSDKDKESQSGLYPAEKFKF